MAATRGTPVQGSRSAHDVTDPNLHASDIENDAFTVHLDPDAAEGEAMVMGSAGKYVATDIVTQAELPHVVLSATHTDTTAAAAVRGDLLVAIGASPLWTRYPLSVPAAGVLNYLGVANGETEPTWKSASANPGAAASILASAPTTGLLTLTQLATTVNLQTLNAEVTVASKNKYLPYLQDASGVYLRRQTYYYTSSYVATEGYGFGLLALAENNGAYCIGIGASAMRYGTALNAIGIGRYACEQVSGNNAVGIGHNVMRYNYGGNTVGIGGYALYSNAGANSFGLGYAALAYNNWPYAISVGGQAGLGFTSDAATDQAFDDSHITANTITFPGAHGFGATGARVNLKFTTVAGTPPSGLVNGTVYQFTIDSATAVSKSSIGTNASADFEGKLTNSVDVTNSISFGYNVNNTKANQVMLGGADIVETVLRGKILVNTTTVGAQLAVDQASATGALPVLLLDQGDDDETMIEFTGTIGEGDVIEAVGAKTLTVTHYLKCEITGVGVRYIALGTIA